MRFGPLPVALILTMAAVGEAAAIQRFYRKVDDRDGGPIMAIFELAQDTEGFIWLGTPAGVGRFDGVRFRSWSERAPRDRPHRILAGSDGEVLVLDQNGALMRCAQVARVIRDAEAADLTIVGGSEFRKRSMMPV